MELKNILRILILIIYLSSTVVLGNCNFEGKLYKNNSKWQFECKICTCLNSITICNQIECKYETCKKGELLTLDSDKCCPSCQYPKKSCKYDGYLIDHNTEFSPKICESCKCRNGQLECTNTCNKDKEIKLVDNELLLNNDENLCFTDDRYFTNNSIWSPLPCTHCKCDNKIIKCYSIECPELDNCPNGDIELRQGECCPKCKTKQCLLDDGKLYSHNQVWTKAPKDPCTHCICLNGNIKCVRENCTQIECSPNETQVSLPGKCCTKCVSKIHTDNCEYFGRIYYNGDIWSSSSSSCQYCACDYGKIICNSIQCEAKFCMNDEIMVKSKDGCCVECRKPIWCDVNDGLRVKENEFWSPEANRLCQCLHDKIQCFNSNSQNEIFVEFKQKTQLDLRKIQFSEKNLTKDSIIIIISSPNYGSILKDNEKLFNFTHNDLESSKIYYKVLQPDFIPQVDYLVLAIKDSKSSKIQTQFLRLVNRVESYSNRNKDYLNDGTAIDLDIPSPKINHKTIQVVPGEAVKLTSNELRPKNIQKSKTLLHYTLVSGKPKYGEIKLKKTLGNDDIVLTSDWTKVNDIYVEKVVKEFSQLDLDKGNVWYEPYSDYDSNTDDECNNKSGENLYHTCLGDDPLQCIPQQTSACYSPLSQYKTLNGAKYDHLMFEVRDKGTNNNQLLSKEILHFSIQSLQIMNETMLGLEVIENQITPFTFSNFDIAGIDSNREYLVYKIIKNLDRNQGQLEHSTRPGISLETFTQSDLNKGHILYHAPKEIGFYPKEFSFSFIVTNDNRGDTFPETPFHIRVLPANDQAPSFKESVAYLDLTQSASLTLTSDLFDVDDPDTYIDNIVFTIEKPADNAIIELRSKGHNYIINKDESFTMQEIRNGTFRLIHNGANILKDSLKISASDGKHIAIKTIYFNIKLADSQAPKVSNKSSLFLSVKEGQSKTLTSENLAYSDEKSTTEEIVYTLHSNKLLGSLYLRNSILKPQMKFTQADIDLQNIYYEPPNEIGPQTQNDLIYFTVSDKDGNKIEDQVLTVILEPIDNQAPVVDITQSAIVQEGGYFVFNEDLIRVRDVDSLKEQLNIVIDSMPSFGYFDNIDTGEKVTSFPLIHLISGNLIRYVQNDHKNKEPTRDSFIFHATDGVNNSPTVKFEFKIEAINDEAPVAVFEPLIAAYNQLVQITNISFLIVDFDTKPEDIKITIEDGPKYGILYLDGVPLLAKNTFTYSNILDKRIYYKNSLTNDLDDEIKFKINDGKFSTVAVFNIKSILLDKDVPIMIKNDGLNAVSGNLYKITKEHLNYKDFDEKLVIYNIISLPSFGSLQYRTETFYNLYNVDYYLVSFSQEDIDKGNIFYYHDVSESNGVTYFSFNVSNLNGKTLPYQRFLISVRDDKLPPIILNNKILKVNQGSSRLLSRYELDVKDDDTPYRNIEFKIISGPKYGFLENTNEPGKVLNRFTYDDLAFNRIRYAHDDTIRMQGDDFVDISVTDGKNDVSFILQISIIRYDNEMPTLVSSGSMKCKLLDRKQITKDDINIIDKDSKPENLKIIITHPPQYGILERVDKELEKFQTNKHKHQFPIKNQTISLILSAKPQYAIAVNEFTLKDIEDGLIYYYHKIEGVLQDNFGFIIFDGVNNMFWVNDVQTSDYQTFNIFIESSVNTRPEIERNIGLDHLGFVEGESRRAITKNELSIIDKDDIERNLVIYITRQPLFGIIENKDLPGIGLSKFTYEDITNNRIFYVLKHQDDLIANDYFLFDIQDSAVNTLKANRFDIKWSIVNFEINELTVMEDDGKARVHIIKTGNLKQYSSVICRTVSDTAKSNTDSKSYDFIHTMVKIDFNEGESYKACDIVIQKDSFNEPIESFFVLLEDPKYSVLGLRNQIKVNILDKTKVSTIEFEKNHFEVHESDKLVSLPIVRSGDLSSDLTVICFTEDDTASSNVDYIPRNMNAFNLNTVHIASGQMYGFCDIELIDDDLHEVKNEQFKAILASPSNGVQLGVKKEAKVIIIGPNDVQTNGCKNVQFTVSESSDRIIIDIQRENIDLNQEFDILCTTTVTSESNKNLTQALPNIDYIPVNEIIHFAPGEQTKKCYVSIINDNSNPVMEGLKVFPVQIRPIKWDPLKPICDYVDPDLIQVIIDDTVEDIIRIGFNQTSFIANESIGKIAVPIIRNGDLSQFVSVICYTRQLTAIEDSDYIGRYSLEQSRINFSPGEKIKDCVIDIIDDSIYEAHEAFQVRLSDLRTSSIQGAQFDQLTQATVTITNDEDATIISLSHENYHTEEPSSNDSLVIKTITVIRTGDLSRASVVRISTSDGTAVAGIDYKPKTEMLTFEPGVSAIDFEIKILFDFDLESVEDFKVYLGPQDPVSAVFGKITSASVFIHENGNLGEGDIFNTINTDYSNFRFLSGMPFATSLAYYVFNKSLDNRFDDRIGIQLVPPGEPLICIHACDQKYPKYHKTKPFCETKFNYLKIKYSWELSTPSDLGKYSDFVKITDDTFFTVVNESVLEPIYYRPKFRLRCVTQFTKLTPYDDNSLSQLNNWPLRSNIIEIDNSYESKISDELGYKKCSKLYPSLQKRLVHNQKFNTRGEYLDDESNLPFIDANPSNLVKLSVELPYSDGMIPLISTQPLYNYRYLLTEPSYGRDHKCSNFINKKLSSVYAKYGFIQANPKSAIGQFSKWRNEKTMKFYSNFDLSSCQWKFEAYFDIYELINECKSSLTSEYETRESGRSLLTLKIPLFMSYVYADIPVGWDFIEYKSTIDLTATYRTLINENNFGEVKNLASLELSKITILPDYKLSFELLTVPTFNGHFLKVHPKIPHFRGNIKGPLKADYALELSWSQFSSEFSEQMWKIKSYNSIYNFVGNYTLELLPCSYKVKKAFASPLDCEVKSPSKLYFTMIREQTIQPVPVKYSLDTYIHLSNKFSNKSGQLNLNFDGLFYKNDQVYGSVTWNPKPELRSIYHLQLEKIYLCSSLNGHIPLYDPDGSVYKKGPQYGCLEPHPLIGKRLLILDRSNPDHVITHVNNVPFDARFIKHKLDSNSRNTTPIMDSFKFNLNPLFSGEFEKNWFIQVLYFVGPESSLRTIKKRENNNHDYYVLTGVYNNGTNIQWLKLSEKKRPVIVRYDSESNTEFGHNQRQRVAYISSLRDLFVKLLLPFLAFIFTITMTAIGVYYFKKKAIDRLRHPKEPPFPVIIDNSNHSHSSSLEIIPTQIQTEYTEKNGHVITKVLKLDPFNDDSNCTLQTVISSTTSTTSSASNESHYAYNHNKANRSPLMYTNKKLKTFFKKKYAPVPSVDTSAPAAAALSANPYNSLKNPKTSTNNYLYYNYNSNDLNRDVVKVNSSMTSLLAKQKSVAGTEV